VAFADLEGVRNTDIIWMYFFLLSLLSNGRAFSFNSCELLWVCLMVFVGVAVIRFGVIWGEGKIEWTVLNFFGKDYSLLFWIGVYYSFGI
jgi:hypothetical protein